MPTYVVLVNFTDQGIRNIKQSTERTRAAMAMAEKLGIKVRNIYLTLGEYDGLIIADAPDEETIMAFALARASLGNIRTQTMRAFPPEETEKILAKIP